MKSPLVNDMKYTGFVIFLIFISIQHILGWEQLWKNRFSDGYLGNPSQFAPNEDVPNEQWFKQRVDHFAPKNSDTFQQRYYVNSQYYESGGPVFLMTSGNGEANPKWAVQGYWMHIAKSFKALCFLVEHRFYGKSRVGSDLSTTNMKSLRIEAAVGDLARFIDGMNKLYNLTDSTKWFGFGGFYGGSLVAWLRLKYPHLLYGAVASSSPLLAKLEFDGYFQSIEDTLRNHSEQCVSVLKDGMNQVQELAMNEDGRRRIDALFRLCDSLEESTNRNLDIATLLFIISARIGQIQEFDKINSPYSGIKIDEICSAMIDKENIESIDRLASLTSLLFNTGNEECLNYKYEKLVTALSDTSASSFVANGLRQWTYQRCSEFSLFHTSNSENFVFDSLLPVEYFTDLCVAIFGEKHNAAILERANKDLNLFYGGLHPASTNILYVHGSRDPWKSIGLPESTNNDSQTIIIDGASHCADMYEPSSTDSPALVAARDEIEAFLQNIYYTKRVDFTDLHVIIKKN